MLSALILKDDERLAAFELKEKSFMAGAGGYSASGRIEIDGKRYSMSLNLVEISSTRSKP